MTFIYVMLALFAIVSIIGAGFIGNLVNDIKKHERALHHQYKRIKDSEQDITNILDLLNPKQTTPYRAQPTKLDVALDRQAKASEKNDRAKSIRIKKVDNTSYNHSPTDYSALNVPLTLSSMTYESSSSSDTTSYSSSSSDCSSSSYDSSSSSSCYDSSSSSSSSFDSSSSW